MAEIRINNVSVVEGDSDITNLNFTVSLDTNPTTPVTVSYTITDDSATSSSDFVFTAQSGFLTFNPGDPLTQSIAVQVNGDTLSEANEIFFVTLTGATGATISTDQGIGVGIIRNDDPLPALSISDRGLDEGNAASTNAEFTVTLSAASEQYVQVNYSTVDGTAKAAEDYSSMSDKLIFAPGELSKTIIVPVKGDMLSEANEKFLVNLTGASNATIADSQAEGTIKNDDIPPSLSINDVTITETNSGAIDAEFTVSLSAISGQTVTVDYATADDSATQNEDYIPKINTITFNPGEQTQKITIPIADDSKYEPNEAFFVNLTNPVHASITDAQGKGIINDNDSKPTISINNVTVTEGNSGATSANFTISLSHPSYQPISISYVTADNTAKAANGDYTAIATKSVTFNPGETTKTIAVEVNGDTIDEPDEAFFVNLSNPVNASLGTSKGTATITDDDSEPEISIGDVTIAEGNDGNTNVTFNVSLSHATTNTVSVNFETIDDTAKETENDYVGQSNTLTFTPGQTSRSITIAVKGDRIHESEEVFYVKLSNPTGATIATTKGQAKAIVTNDDLPPRITINDATLTEGDDGTKTATFTVSLSNSSDQIITVDYTTEDKTATTTNNDYVTLSDRLTFNPGDTTKDITVIVNGDTTEELDESFLVKLVNVSNNASITDAQAEGTIKNDDALPDISIEDIELVEGNNDSTNAVFTVFLSTASTQTVKVNYTTASLSASTSDNDYTTTSGTLTFDAGSTQQTIVIPVTGDTKVEADETFAINLSGAVNVTIEDDQAIATIKNDDRLPTLSINDLSLNEGNNGITNATFTVSLSSVSPQQVRVNYRTLDGTATTVDKDYAPLLLTSLLFNPNEISKTITVAVNGDITIEPDETFSILLSNATNATIAKETGVAKLVNDDSQSPSLVTPSPAPTSSPMPAPISTPTLTPGTIPTNPSTGDTPSDSSDLTLPPVNTIVGTENADVLVGSDADNQISGLGDNDSLDGLDGNDTMDGGLGNDTLIGGNGNDTLVDQAGDDLLDGGNGNDLLISRDGKDQLFGGNGDDILFAGRGDDQLYGQQGNDQLYGRKGNDLLVGGDGNDILMGQLGTNRLVGGAGSDRFALLFRKQKADHILDFSVADDTIGLSHINFRLKQKVGTLLAAKQFTVGSRASDPHDRIIYNRSTGALLFDIDGIGARKQIEIAQLSKGLALTHQDIVVIA